MFKLTLPYTTTPITNQKSSGRCRLFASTNVVRYIAAQKLDGGQLSTLSGSVLAFLPNFDNGWVLIDSNPTRRRTFSSGTSLRNPIITSKFALSWWTNPSTLATSGIWRRNAG